MSQLNSVIDNVSRRHYYFVICMVYENQIKLRKNGENNRYI